MKITLVNPPYPHTGHQHPPFIPLSLGYLGAVSEKNGHEVNVIDCQAERLEPEDFRKRISQTDADVVGITSTTLTYKSALKIANVTKEELPNCTAVLGGCHASFWDENALKECPSLDIIVRREGEITFIELLEKLQSKSSLNSVKGITFRKSDGAIARNEDRPFMENLDDLPFPAFHLFPLSTFRRVEKICDEIVQRKLAIHWDCEARVDMVNEHLLQKMKAAGCMALWFGVESGSQLMIEKMHKRIKLDQTRNAFKTAQELGIMTIANVVLGFPGETEQTAWETLNFIKELNPGDVGFYIATPYPGTPLYEQVKQNGWLKKTDFNYYQTATPTFETPFVSMEKLREIRYKALQQFYLRPGYVLEMLRRGGIYGISSVKTSAAYLLRALHVKLS